MAKKYFCPVCGTIHEATEQPAQCTACYEGKPEEIANVVVQSYYNLTAETVITISGKRYTTF